MVKSSDFMRCYKAVEEDRIRRLVRQHKAERESNLLKDEFLPRTGILAFLAGWLLMSTLNRKNQ